MIWRFRMSMRRICFLNPASNSAFCLARRFLSASAASSCRRVWSLVSLALLWLSPTIRLYFSISSRARLRRTSLAPPCCSRSRCARSVPSLSLMAAASCRSSPSASFLLSDASCLSFSALRRCASLALAARTDVSSSSRLRRSSSLARSAEPLCASCASDNSSSATASFAFRYRMVASAPSWGVAPRPTSPASEEDGGGARREAATDESWDACMSCESRAREEWSSSPVKNCSMLRDAPREPPRAEEEPGRAEEGDSVGFAGEVSAERPREEVVRERAGELASFACCCSTTDCARRSASVRRTSTSSFLRRSSASLSPPGPASAVRIVPAYSRFSAIS
mmetsp:Transcript_20637/g.49007  ORF Transcript_20637/g.49007 Transcript_20637/m.49007 type:complete len:338 (-) Transcript_20637:7-1020(-)